MSLITSALLPLIFFRCFFNFLFYGIVVERLDIGLLICICVDLFLDRIFSRTNGQYMNITGTLIGSNITQCSSNGNTIIRMNNGNITINGQEYSQVHEIMIKSSLTNAVLLNQHGHLKFEINGDVTSLDSQSAVSITVKGSVSHLNTASGDIEIGNDVTGNVEATSGDIKIKGNVLKDVTCTSGDIHISGTVGGKVSTLNGDIECNGCRKCKRK